MLNSANASAPSRDNKPQEIQTIRQRPTDPDLSRALVGDTNIPEPKGEMINRLKRSSFLFVKTKYTKKKKMKNLNLLIYLKKI